MPWSLLAYRCRSLSSVSVEWSGRDASPSLVIPPQFVRFPQQFAGAHLYSWVERGTIRVKCLAQEHNIVSPARDRTRTTRSGDERTNHEATAPPIYNCKSCKNKSWKDFLPTILPTTSAIPAQCSTSWATKPTRSWPRCDLKYTCQDGEDTKFKYMFYREQWLQ